MIWRPTKAPEGAVCPACGEFVRAGAACEGCALGAYDKPNIALFIVYNAPGASTFHADIVKAITATGKLPEELDDVLSLSKVTVDGAVRWIVDFA